MSETHALTTRVVKDGAGAGSAIDPGLATYYAPVPENELHPAWSTYHQQKQNKSVEAAAAHECSSAVNERQGNEPETISAAAQSDDTQAEAWVGSEPGGPLSKIKQGLARTTRRIGETLEQGRAAADRARDSSTQFIRNRSSAWSSSSSEWKHNPSKPDWPAQLATLDHADSTSKTASQAPPADSDSAIAQAIAATHLPLPEQATAGGPGASDPAVDPAAAPDGTHPHAEQLLSSFRLHSGAQPSILSSLSVPLAQDLPLHQNGVALSLGHTYCRESGILIPEADTSACIGQSIGSHNPVEFASSDHGSDWDATDVGRGDLSQVSQPADFNDRPNSPKQAQEGLPSDQPIPTPPSGRLGRVRMGAGSGREDALVEPKYTPGVQAPPRGTLQISATAGAVHAAVRNLMQSAMPILCWYGW